MKAILFWLSNRFIIQKGSTKSFFLCLICPRRILKCGWLSKYHRFDGYDLFIVWLSDTKLLFSLTRHQNENKKRSPSSYTWLHQERKLAFLQVNAFKVEAQNVTVLKFITQLPCGEINFGFVFFVYFSSEAFDCHDMQIRTGLLLMI